MSREQKFWSWFGRHQDEYFDFEVPAEEAFDRLAAQRHKGAAR